MTQYLIAIHLPDNFDPSVQHKAMFRGRPAPDKQREVTARAARWQGHHHRRAIPGNQGAHRRFWVVEAANLDEALAWGRKAVVACRAPVEVRPFGQPGVDWQVASRRLKPVLKD